MARERAMAAEEAVPAGTPPALVERFEALLAENRALKALVQELRGEIARLKGEQGKPQVRPRAPRQHSTEQERPREEPPARQRSPDKRVLLVQREEVLRLDRASLPAGVEHAGYEDFVVQEVRVQAEVVRYRRET